MSVLGGGREGMSFYVFIGKDEDGENGLSIEGIER